MRRMTVASSMSAMSRNRPPHRGQASTSNPPPSREALRRASPEPWRRREGPLHQRGPLSPAPAIGALGSSRRAKPLVLDARRRTIGRVGSRPVDDLRAPAGTRAEHTVVQEQIDPRPWHEDRQASEEVHRVEHEVRRPVTPWFPQRHAHLPVVGHMEAIDGDGHHRRDEVPNVEVVPEPKTIATAITRMATALIAVGRGVRGGGRR